MRSSCSFVRVPLLPARGGRVLGVVIGESALVQSGPEGGGVVAEQVLPLVGLFDAGDGEQTC